MSVPGTEPGSMEERFGLQQHHAARERAQLGRSTGGGSGGGADGGSSWFATLVVWAVGLIFLAFTALLAASQAQSMVPEIRAAFDLLPSSWIEPSASTEGWRRGIGYWTVTGVAAVIGVTLVTTLMAWLVRVIPAWVWLFLLVCGVLSIVRAAIVMAAIVVALLAVPVVEAWPADDWASPGWPPLVVAILVALPTVLLGLRTMHWGAFLPRGT